jgi:PAS domain S-box-containing protein
MKRSVVIIEGNAEEAKLFESMLTGASDAVYSVTTALTGDEGLAAIEAMRPNCVLLDYNLPGQQSAATLSRVHARYPSLSVVMLTSEEVDFEVLESMTAEGQEYLNKAVVSPDSLHQAVNNAILGAMSRAQSSQAKSTYKVLIIDDNADDREAFTRALKKADERYRCAEAGEGLAGIAMIEELRPDCVLLDYSMPALNGLEILKRIHAIDAFLPVIMLTGLGNETVAVQAMKGGAQNYLVKTWVTSSLLHSAISSAVEHSALERKIHQQRSQIQEQKIELARSHRLNTAILNSAARYMIVATDSKGTVLAFNPAAERELGYAAEEVLGKESPLLWLDTDELAERATHISAELGAITEPDFGVLTHAAVLEGSSQQEWTCIRRNGDRFTANLSVSPLRGMLGEATGFLIVAEDITTLKQQQDALKAREELFRGAMEDAPNGMALIDIGGRFLKVNDALCQLLGYTAGQLHGKHPEDVTDPDDAEIDLENVRELLAGKIQSYKVEKRLVREDGSIVHVLLAMSLMHNIDGSPNYFVAQFQDITDRKEIERLKSDFVSMVSHELRTPVTSIRGAVGLLANIERKDLSPRGQHLIDIANKNCDRLIAIVNDILDIDRIASGQLLFEIKDEDVASLLQEAIEAHRGYTERMGANVLMEPVATNLIVNVDAARLIQVLFNLLSNAAKHSPEGGQIRVSAGRVGSRVRISVKDQGPGIEERYAKHLFEKFSQAGTADSRGTKGSGLGLHISKQIIEQMGGQIGLETKLGIGSTFWIELPTPDAVDAPTSAERKAQQPQAKRILICEDDDNLAAIIQLMLSMQGYVADIVHNVPEARRRLMSGDYDAMTLDITLPLGDGLDLAREVHGQAQTRTLPIVVVSGHPDQDNANLREDAGIVDWVVKPFDKERLLQSIVKAASEPLKLAQSA